MRGSRARIDEATEGTFRGPERLALAMPLTAALGLVFVLAAAALGHSALVVTLVAIGGFTLCAFAPLALTPLYVGRPMRLALAHLRAARDGAEPPRASPPPGVIADLVAVARDIQAERRHGDSHRAGLALCEKMAAAGDEAIRALRLQSEAMAESQLQSQNPARGAAQDQFVEIAEALKALKEAAPPSGLESGVQRIEEMLVYLADTLDRREKPADDGDRTDAALTDLVRLIGRETQAIRDTVATAALTVRNDIAGAVADDKAAQGRQQERVEAMEARVLTRLGDIADTSRVVDAIRAEAETTRRALRDRPEPAPQALTHGLGEVAERLREQSQAQAGRFDDIEARLKALTEAGHDGQSHALSVLAKCTDKLRNALDRFDVLSAAAATAGTSQSEAIGAAVRALEGEIAGLGQRLAQETPALRRDTALGVRWGETFEMLRADVTAVGPRIEDACEGIARRMEALNVKAIQAATRDLAAAQTRAESFARQIAVGAAALAALTERESRDFDGLRAAFQGAEAAVAGAATALSHQWANTMQTQSSLWRETFGAWGEGALASLDETNLRLAQTGAALARAAEEIETVAARARDAQTRLDDALAPPVCALPLETETSEAPLAPEAEGRRALATVETVAKDEETNHIVRRMTSAARAMRTGPYDFDVVSAAVSEDDATQDYGVEEAYFKAG